MRSDNGFIYQSRCFRSACRFYRLGHEFTTPHAPKQNGIIERFFRSLKEEFTWQHNFFDHRKKAKVKIARWLRWYNHRRPLQALGYRSPAQCRADQLSRVA